MSLSSRVGVIVLVVSLVAACTGSGDPPTTTNPEVTGPTGTQPPGSDRETTTTQPSLPTPTPGVSEVIWQVEVVRNQDGTVNIGEVTPVEVTLNLGVPPGPLDGSHVLAGVNSAGEPLDGQWIRFPEQVEFEYRGDDYWGSDEISLAGQEVSTTGYIRALPGTTRIAVLDDQGNELTATPASAHSDTQRHIGVQSLMPISHRPDDPAFSVGETHLWSGNHAYLQTVRPSPDCPHVKLAGTNNQSGARQLAYAGLQVVQPGPRQAAAVVEALATMRPFLCQSVSWIFFTNGFKEAKRPTTTGAVAAVSGDMIAINAEIFTEASLQSALQRLELVTTIIHEAAHTATYLIESTAGTGSSLLAEWLNRARTEAKEALVRLRMQKGLIAEWNRLHNSFVEEGWARRYPSSDADRKALDGRAPAMSTAAGNMSAYGGLSEREDIAEVVARVYTGQQYQDNGFPREDHGCVEMQKQSGTGVPAALSAIYTKVMFVKDLGLVDPLDAEDCVGNVGIPIDGVGMHYWQGTQLLTTYGLMPDAGIGKRDRDGMWVFQMIAQGEAKWVDKTWDAELRVHLAVAAAGEPLHRASWPRGVYPLAFLGDNTYQVELHGEGGGAGNSYATDGWVLVTESTRNRIVGAVFVPQVRRPFAPSPLFDFDGARVFDQYDPPLVVRFLLERPEGFHSE